MSAGQNGAAARDSRGRLAPATASTDPLRDLAKAVLEALDIPHAATFGDDKVREPIMTERVMHARIALEGVLERGDDPGWSADFLRARLAEHPADGYRHVGEAAPPSCGRCRTPFDSTDQSFDGAARSGATPWCRSCVDNCHEGSAEHVCVICDPARYGGDAR
ncbi:hypothetical protein [Streptomyces wuyuanensis]|uniref:hypothetical protein n=1 Tax=Streptomyces wuyuanensis TaxID=1196353 RepID=UPI003430FE02